MEMVKLDFHLIVTILLVNTTPGAGETGMYNIRFFTSEDLTNPQETITGNTGQEKNMPSNPTKTGFYFIGWNSKSDGSGENYSGTKITIPSTNLDLHAIWSTILPETTKLDNLIIKSIKDNGSKDNVNGVPNANNSYNVKKDKDVTIVLTFSYNKPSSNLKIIATGSSESILSSENQATITVMAPNKNMEKVINVEIREISNSNISDSILITLVGE